MSRKGQFALMTLVVYQVLVAFSLLLLTSDTYDALTSLGKVVVAVFASTLCQIWAWTMSFYEDMARLVQKQANVAVETPPSALEVAVVTLVYGVPGCIAGCMLGFLIINLTPGSIVGIPVLLGIYAWTFSGFGLSDDYIVKHKQGMDGDGI